MLHNKEKLSNYLTNYRLIIILYMLRLDKKGNVISQLPQYSLHNLFGWQDFTLKGYNAMRLFQYYPTGCDLLSIEPWPAAKTL